MSSFKLENRTVVITGASGGFGSELTKILVNKYGCRVIGVGRTKEKLEALSDSLYDNKNKFRYFVFDVSRRDNWQLFTRLLSKKGIVPDLLINNAGIMPPFEKFKNEDGALAAHVINVNLMSVIYGCEAMIPLLLKSKQGGIVNIASSAAFSPVIGTAVYSASKGAVKNFTMALAEEMKDELYVSAVCPGFSETDLFRNNGFTKDDFEFVSGLGTDKKDMAESIIKGVRAKKKVIICGKDSKLMTLLSSVSPSGANSLYTRVLTSTGLEMFSGISE